MTSIDVWGTFKRHFGVWGSYFILSLTYLIFRLPEGVGFFEGTTASFYNYHSWSHLLSLDLARPLVEILTDTIPVGDKLYYSWGPLPGWYFLLWGNWVYLGLSFILTGVLGSLHYLSRSYTKSDILSCFSTLLFVFSAPLNEVFLSDFDTIPVNSLFTLLLSVIYFASVIHRPVSLRSLLFISTLALLHRIDLFACMMFVTFFFWVQDKNNRKIKEPLFWLSGQGVLLAVINYMKFGSFMNMGAGINKIHNDFYSYIIYFDYSLRDFLTVNWAQLILAAIRGDTFWGNQSIIYIEFQGFLLFFSLLLALCFHRIMKEYKVYEGVFLFPFSVIFYLLTIRILESRYLLFLVPVSLIFISVLLGRFASKKQSAFLLILVTLWQGSLFLKEVEPLPYLFSENKKNLSQVFQDDWAQIPSFLHNDRYRCQDILSLTGKDQNFFFPGILDGCEISSYLGFWQYGLSKQSCQLVLRFQNQMDCSKKNLRSDEGDLPLRNIDNYSCITPTFISSYEQRFHLLLLEPNIRLISTEYHSGHHLESIEKQCSTP